MRSSRRIVAGSDAFQLAVDEVTSHHAAEEPPLKAFIFDRPDTSTEGMSALYMAYAEHIIKALEHTMKLIGEISLHDRVAVVVPDAAFADGLRPTLDSRSSAGGKRAFELIDPMEAAASAINQPSGNSSGNVLRRTAAAKDSSTATAPSGSWSAPSMTSTASS